MKTGHLIGIGGSGMNALARLMREQGWKVTGSDSTESETTRKLIEEGIEVRIGQKGENVPKEAELVVYSRAIMEDNPERVAARERGIRSLTYFEALGEALREWKLVAVTGTHGKTTTTAMLALGLIAAGQDPTAVVGSSVPQMNGSNFRFGKGEWAVAEACEYGRNFLGLHPHDMIVTTLDYDHPDTYPTPEDYVQAFCELASKLPEDGLLILPEGNKKAEKLAEVNKAKVVYFSPLEIELTVPGEHNRSNAGAVWKWMIERGLANETVQASLEVFEGTGRRFEILGEKNGMLFISDYAHHPVEIRATLKAAREKYGERKIRAVFQAHQYSRTAALLDEFATAFVDANEVYVTEIYAARDTEEDKQKVSGERLAEAIKGVQVFYTGNLQQTAKRLQEEGRAEEVVILMGAGNVPEVFKHMDNGK